MYFDPKMTLEEYEDFKLHDEINIGYDVEDDDLPDEIEEDSWIDGLLTSGFLRLMMMNYLEKKSQDILYINFIFGGCNS